VQKRQCSEKVSNSGAAGVEVGPHPISTNSNIFDVLMAKAATHKGNGPGDPFKGHD